MSIINLCGGAHNSAIRPFTCRFLLVVVHSAAVHARSRMRLAQLVRRRYFMHLVATSAVSVLLFCLHIMQLFLKFLDILCSLIDLDKIEPLLFIGWIIHIAPVYHP